MNKPQPPIFHDNDDFTHKYLRNKKDFTDAARSVKITNPLTGDSGKLPNVFAELVDEYMKAKNNQAFLGNMLQGVPVPMPDATAELVAKAIDRFNNTAYALHKVIMKIRANDYMDEGLSAKLANRDATINKLRRELKECRAELKEGYRGRVRPLGKSEGKTETGGTEAPVP